MKRSLRQNASLHDPSTDDLAFSVRVRTHFSRIREIADAKPFLDEELLTAVLENAADFAAHVLAPLRRLDADSAVSKTVRRKEAYKAIFSDGWSGISVSQELGGLGLPTILRAPLLEIMGSADPELWNCIDTSMLLGGLISNLGDEWLKVLIAPKVSAGEWSIEFAADIFDDSPCRMRAVLLDNGAFKVSGTVERSDPGMDFADQAYCLVKALACRDGGGGNEPALFLVPKGIPQDDGQAEVPGWYVASMQSAHAELTRLKHAHTLRAAIGAMAMRQSPWHGHKMDAWRSAILAYACAIDLAERHTDARVRLESGHYMSITLKIFESWLKEGRSTPLAAGLADGVLMQDELRPDGGAAFRSWLNRVYRTVCRLDLHPFTGSDAISGCLRNGAESLQRIVEGALANDASTSGIILDHAQTILPLFTKVFSCAELANGALYAAQCVPSDRWDKKFLNDKIQVARNVCAHELPQQQPRVAAVD